jgi:hypothetical protein
VRVNISREARALREAQIREAVASPTTDAPSKNANVGGRPSVLAVRVGIPDAPQIADSEELLRKKLAEGSGVQTVRLGGLLSTPKSQERAASGAETRGSRGDPVELQRTRAHVEVPGGPKPVTLPGVEASRPAPRTAPKAGKLPVEDPRVAEEARKMRQREILERVDRRVDLETAVAAAGQSGVARTEEEAHTRRTDSMREADAKDEAARERAIREALTKAGVVEAEAESELVTRFAERAFEQDLGRPERTVEHLGNRSSSPSKLNG